MAEIGTAWTARGAWTGIVAPGAFGGPGDGVKVCLREGLGMASLIAGREQEPALGRALKSRYGLALPTGPSVVSSASHSLAWAGPGQWLLVAASRAGFAEDCAGLAETAAVAEQSDGRAVLSLSGSMVGKTLAKGCMVDLHPRAFPVGMTALTSIAYIGIQLWRSEDGPDGAVYQILVPRSMAGSFWSWLSASAAEFGCAITTADA
ncbi:MAG: sarcosine oxidase subunit gamma family protein [Bosea sp. (in: a-proteobacteria)]|uniref:sarcosine oxidase subunit gamma n=1 Tax=Bosea sp. (in: a-proteobacteria) TaxID=1871050 RepID=UPI002732B039|nr:sarcosine oxidase subunit gamma family protein [Bosea sp. (in: a-proteobacteria)]MDP3255246.1 sarcosine oxidase subunit gamma family protein [Bosea sp. (in: a-proteobacteria)]MDP3320701.1 sarcosine oxidase subunit gamma family protein [Bosea sp. (in: a-proteobacteria)]